jgi:hypothetical protein
MLPAGTRPRCRELLGDSRIGVEAGLLDADRKQVFGGEPRQDPCAHKRRLPGARRAGEGKEAKAWAGEKLREFFQRALPRRERIVIVVGEQAADRSGPGGLPRTHPNQNECAKPAYDDTAAEESPFQRTLDKLLDEAGELCKCRAENRDYGHHGKEQLLDF